MALTLKRLNDLRSEQDEEEEKKKKTSGSARLKAAMENEAVPQPTKTPEAKTTGTAKLSGSARLQAAMETEPAKTTATETQTPQISNTYREVDKENGRIRTRSADLSTPSWQDDPDEMAAELNMLGATLEDTGSKLTTLSKTRAMANSAVQNIGNQVEAYETKLGMLADTAANSTDAGERLRAQNESKALDLYYQKAKLAQERYTARANELNSQFDTLAGQYESALQEYQATEPKYTRRLGLGDSKAAEYEKQAEELRKQADDLYRAGQANYTLVRQAEQAEANAQKERQNYAQYLYSTEGKDKAMKYAAGEREKKETANRGMQILNTLSGMAVNFLDAAASAPLLFTSRLMEIPDDIAYAITKDEKFRQDRNSDALRAANPFTPEIQRMQQNAGGLGGKLVDLAGTAGNMMSLSAFGGAVLSGTKAAALAEELGSLANSSPLVTSTATRMGAKVGAAILGDIARNPGNAAISASAGLNAYSDALDNGASFGDAVANGVMQAAAEYFSNKMFSGTPFEDVEGQKGYVTQIIEKAAEKLGKSDVLKTFNASTGGKVLNWLFDKTGEGMEEVITAVLDPLIEYVTYNPNGSVDIKLEQLIEEFEGGVLLSLLMSGGEAALKPSLETAQIKQQIMDMGYSKEIANAYAPGIRTYLKTVNKMAEAVQDAAKTETQNQQTPKTVMAQIVQKVTGGETLSGQDARKILADPEAKQTLIDAGLITGREINDSAGRTKVANAAEQYIRQQTQETAEQQTTPPVPQAEAQTAPQAEAQTEVQAETQTEEKTLTGADRLNAAMEEGKQKTALSDGTESQKKRNSKTSTVVEHLRQNAETLLKDTPVATIDGNEIPKNGRATDRVMAFLRTIGNKVTRDGFGDVLFSRSKVKTAMVGHGASNAKVETIAAVPAVIKNGKQIDHIENYEGRGYDSYIFAAPVIYKGTTTLVGVVVDKDMATGRYYVHEVVDSNGNILMESTEPESTVDRSPERDRPVVKSSSELNITQSEQTVNKPRIRTEQTEETLTPAQKPVNLLANNRTGANNNGQTETSRSTGAIVPGGNGERGSGLRAGKQAGQVGRSPEGWRTLSRTEKAAARRAYADDVGVRPVSARSLGVNAAAEDSTVRVYPREAWEPDLQRIASKVEKATGKPVSFVLGEMKVNAGGKMLTVRGVNTGKGIIVQADDPSITPEKIATHEAFHAFAAEDPGLSARVLEQIRKQFPENRLRQIAGTYLEKLYGIVDLDSVDKAVLSKALKQVRDEICADAYAGINAFSANADEYSSAARQAVTEARRESAAATERKTGPPQEQYSADEDYIPESAAEYDQMKRQGKFEAPKITKPVSKSTATIAKADLRKSLMTAYSIPAGSRAEIGKMIDALADQYLKNKSISWSDREDLINKLWESGVMHMDADDGFQAVRELVNKGRIYVPESIKHEFGDWNSFRREAMGEGIYLVNDETAAGWDQWNAELSDAFPGIFSEDEYDGKNFLERVVDLARKGKGENLTLAEYAAKTGGLEYATEEDMMDNLERQADYALKAFAEKANLEIYLKDRTGVKIAQERQRMGELLDNAVARERERGNKRVQAARESGANALAREKQREEDRRKKEREHRKEVAQRLRERQAMRELQQKTLKQLQWLSRNQNKFHEEAKKQVQDLLEDMDVLAVSAAEEMHIDNATGKTWKDLRDMYLEAKEKDPNWMPSAQLEKIVMRLDAKKIGDLDMNALQDLYKAAIGIRTELYNRNNVIDDELHSTFAEVYEAVKEEMQETPGSYETGVKGGINAFLNDAQLTPMNRFQRMAGWNPNSRWYGMAKMLEKGEREQRRFKTEANRQIAPVLEQYADWARRADGKGKNAIWYEIKVPASWEYHMGDKPVFSKETVTVYMTPAQKVHMYLESKNLDNLRHMEGGRTFANKELYSKGERAEAFAQGTTVKLLPETVKSIVSDLTEEEQALANALEAFYNDYSKKEINRVSDILYGYDKAMGGYYAPIYTNNNYTKSEPGIFDLTAEGVGNLKSRVVSANPSLNLSAFDAFEKSVDKTGRFVGLSIPIRNLNTLMNWREQGNSTKEILDHKWGEKTTKWVEDLMTELQSGKDRSNSSIEALTNKALSRYITAVFGANASIVAKQFASHPLAATYLEWKNLITGLAHVGQADPELISKYTGELDYRMLGYAMPETAQIKDNPGILQRKGPINFLFGGGAITWMDGFTVRTLWSAAEQKVSREQPDLEIGTQKQINAGQSPYYQAVAKEFEEAVSRSQPMYDTMHRSNIMRETNPITRAFTLFKTVPQQEYNMLRQAVGEAEYYKRTGADKEIQAEARKKAGRAFAGVLIGNLMIGVVSFLNALWKNKGKYFRDEEGELTPESVAKGLGKQYFKDTAGLAIGGDIAADVLSSILFGDKWYGLEMPGLEQLGSILEQSVNAGNTVKKTVADSIDILLNGGDWGQYMADHSETYLNAVDQIVSTLGTYATGLPMDNVKAYLLGGVQWISPQIKTAYDDLMKQADKSGLKDLTGASLEMRTMHILQDRAGSADQRTAETVAGLYEAGYTDAVPATIQSKYTVNGEDRKMSAADDQLYRQVWRDSVSGTLDEITNDKVFRTMSQADQAKVLKKLYDYGAQNAKEAVWPDYSPDKWVTMAKGLEAKDVPLSEWLPIQQDLSKISGNNKKQEIRDYIDSLPYSRDQKKAMYTAEGYQDADEVNWHSGAYGSGKGKTYAKSGLRIPTPERRAPISSGLKLPSAPAAKPTTGGLKLR